MWKTRHRNVRVPDDRWTEFDRLTHEHGTNRAAVLNAFMAWYIGESGAKRVERPESVRRKFRQHRGGQG